MVNDTAGVEIAHSANLACDIIDRAHYEREADQQFAR